MQSVAIIEAYRDWSPPVDAAATVRKLLDSLPERYLIGLRTVILTNRGGLPRGRRRKAMWSRGRKVRMSSCLGIYHGASRRQQPWIELFVDAIVARSSRWTMRVPLLREMAFGSVLYHEIGHHLHATQAPVHLEREDVADSWKRELRRLYVRRQYWYLRPVARVLRPLLRMLSRLLKAAATRKRSRPLSGRGGK